MQASSSVMSFKSLSSLNVIKKPRMLSYSNSPRVSASSSSFYSIGERYFNPLSIQCNAVRDGVISRSFFYSSNLLEKLSPFKESRNKRYSEPLSFVRRESSALTTKSSLTTPITSPFHLQSNEKKTFLIGVAGGTASGKTSVCHKILESLEDEFHGHLTSISQDCFYRDLTAEEHSNVSDYNFDHPDAFDFAEMLQILNDLKNGLNVNIPMYDYAANARLLTHTKIRNATVVLVEGILVFHNPEIRNLFDVKLFVDTDADTRLARRMRRDIVERGRNVIQVLDRYEKSVKPSFELYTLPTKAHADIIIPRGAENTVAISLIVQHIKSLLQARNTY